MIEEWQSLRIEKLKTHTVFIPVCTKEVFTECSNMLLKFSKNKSFINSQSICNNGLKNIKGTSFTMNTQQLISNGKMTNIYDTEQLLIDDLCNLCQSIANIVKRNVYYHINFDKYTTSSFKITPQSN